MAAQHRRRGTAATQLPYKDVQCKTDLYTRGWPISPKQVVCVHIYNNESNKRRRLLYVDGKIIPIARSVQSNMVLHLSFLAIKHVLIVSILKQIFYKKIVRSFFLTVSCGLRLNAVLL
jgi:hypothetical protein